MSDFQLFSVSKAGVSSLPVREDVQTLHDLYRGFNLGVYSALRTFQQNRFLGLDAHIKRTKQSIALLNWNYQLDEALLRRGLHEILSQYPYRNARVRFDILPEPVKQSGQNFQILIGVAPFAGIPKQFYAEGVKVGFADALNRDNPLAKTADFVTQRQSFPIGTEETYERILVNEKGQILECTSSNFYAVIHGKIYTANEGILEGITRKIILMQIDLLGFPIVLEAPSLEQIPKFDEAGLSSSSRAIIPIVQIGEQLVGNGRPGPIMQQLLSSYQEYVQNAVQPALA